MVLQRMCVLAGFQDFIGSTLKSAFENSEMLRLRDVARNLQRDDIAAIIFILAARIQQNQLLCASRTYLFKRRTQW